MGCQKHPQYYSKTIVATSADQKRILFKHKFSKSTQCSMQKSEVDLLRVCRHKNSQSRVKRLWWRQKSCTYRPSVTCNQTFSPVSSKSYREFPIFGAPLCEEKKPKGFAHYLLYIGYMCTRKGLYLNTSKVRVWMNGNSMRSITLDTTRQGVLRDQMQITHTPDQPNPLV